MTAYANQNYLLNPLCVDLHIVLHYNVNLCIKFDTKVNNKSLSCQI